MTRRAITSRSAAERLASACRSQGERVWASSSCVRSSEARVAGLASTATLFRSEVVERRRAGDLAEPGALGASGRVESVPQANGALEGLGGQILGRLRVAREVQDVPVDVVQVPLGGIGERARHRLHTPHIRRFGRNRHTFGAFP